MGWFKEIFRPSTKGMGVGQSHWVDVAGEITAKPVPEPEKPVPEEKKEPKENEVSLREYRQEHTDVPEKPGGLAYCFQVGELLAWKRIRFMVSYVGYDRIILKPIDVTNAFKKEKARSEKRKRR